MSAPNHFSDLIFVAHDVDESGIKEINQRISNVADNMRSLGVDVAWVVTISPSTEMMNDPNLADYIEYATPDRKKDYFLYKAGAIFLTDQNHRFFQAANKKRLVVAGYHASSCCLLSIKASLEQGYEVTFLTNCTNFKSIDPVERVITLTRLFRSDYDLGERPYAELLKRYPNTFRLMTDREYFEDIRQKTRQTVALLELPESESEEGSRNTNKPWTYNFC